MWTPNDSELVLLPAHDAHDRNSGDPSVDGVAPELTFRAVDEPHPGGNWLRAYTSMWPAYRAWWLKEGDRARPDLSMCTAMLDTWMPELRPTFERLVDLTGGDPLAARFLSMYRPPGFVVGCSQAAFVGGDGPALVRNYDYPASRAEGIVYRTSWTGRCVIGMSDCLWGLLDGINDAGLAASLTFGGRPAVGDGFGIPLVIRYVLEVCEDVETACGVLATVPVHAVQNVTLLDRGGDFATIRLGPDRDPEVLTVPVATNHQHRGDWPEYERAVATFARERRLLELLRTAGITSDRLVQAFLRDPLYRAAFASGFGTLYTAVYFPAEGRAEYRWPGHVTTQTFERFAEQRHTQHYAGTSAQKPQSPDAKERL